jgi:hypothetical protein
MDPRKSLSRERFAITLSQVKGQRIEAPRIILALMVNSTQAGSPICYTNSPECGVMSEKYPAQAPRTQGTHATG